MTASPETIDTIPDAVLFGNRFATEEVPKSRVPGDRHDGSRCHAAGC